MSLHAAIVLVAVGLIVGWLSGAVMKIGGFGLKADIALGIAGSMAGAAAFHGLSSAAEPGWLMMVAGAVLGATSFLVVQRMFWQMRPVPTRNKR